MMMNSSLPSNGPALSAANGPALSVANGAILAIDIGTVHTRALLFDIVDGSYRLLGTGAALTSVRVRVGDPGEGVRRAIRDLENHVGRALLDDQERLVMPVTAWNSGIDLAVGTVSAGSPVKILLVGLLEAVSLESLKHLAQALYPGEVRAISLDNLMEPQNIVESVVNFRPDLILAAGGMENGAEKLLLDLYKSVAGAFSLLPSSERPGIVYAGNSKLHETFRDLFPQDVLLQFADNIRPSLEEQNLEDALEKAADLYGRLRARQLFGGSGFISEPVQTWLPTAVAFGQVIRFLSKVQRSKKGVLGIDIGASAATLAAANAGQLRLGTYPQMGLCQGLSGLFDEIPVQRLSQWVSMPLPESLVREYVLHKAIYPASLPFSDEELAIEHALVKLILQWMVQRLKPAFPAGLAGQGSELLPWFEPVIATGSVLTHSPSLGMTMLVLLDGLQPSGVTTFILDQHQVLPALGAIASRAPVATVQVLESTAFQNLGTVISPAGKARPDSPILRLKIKSDDGQESAQDIQQGSLVAIPLPVGQVAHLHLQPLQRFDVGMGGPGMSGTLRVVGGTLGVIIDARGRPLVLPSDPYQRYDLMQTWLKVLGG